MAALGFVFTGVAVLVASLVEHSRAVYGAGLAALVLAYLLRGIGDVTHNWLSWLSPLGWQEKVRAFGDDPRWWPLLISIFVGLALVAAAIAETGRRDLGEALLSRESGPSRASTSLRTPFGLAARLPRGPTIGWAAGAVVVSGTFGSLAQATMDAIAGNEELGKAMNIAGTGLDAVVTMSVLLLGLLCGAYVIQAFGVLREEEASGRLETHLSGPRSRASWLATNVLVVLGGLLVVAGLGGLTFSAATAWSTGNGLSGAATEALLAYLPAVLVVGALTLLLFGLFPRFQQGAWLAFGVTALIAYLGEPLDLPRPLLALSPFHLVGSPPQHGVDVAMLVVLSAAAMAMSGVAFASFRRRDIPQG